MITNPFTCLSDYNSITCPATLHPATHVLYNAYRPSFKAARPMGFHVCALRWQTNTLKAGDVRRFERLIIPGQDAEMDIAIECALLTLSR